MNKPCAFTISPFHKPHTMQGDIPEDCEVCKLTECPHNQPDDGCDWYYDDPAMCEFCEKPCPYAGYYKESDWQ